MVDSNDFTSEILNGKNIKSVLCKYCSSMILEPATGNYIEFEFLLPLVTQNVKEPKTQTEQIKSHWEVANMYSFFNIGFSNTVENTKYLTCADCDAGPIGYHDLATKKSYVALSRVQHK